MPFRDALWNLLETSMACEGATHRTRFMVTSWFPSLPCYPDEKGLVWDLPVMCQLQFRNCIFM